MEKIIGIYKITSPSERIYIGQSINVYGRWSDYKRNHCKEQRRLYNSLKKYGHAQHKFEIIHQCEESELNRLEKYYVDLFQTFNTEHGMNLKDGGYYSKASNESRIKMSKAQKGRVVSAQGRKNMSIAQTGIKHTKERKEKNRLRMMGKKNTLGMKFSNEINMKKARFGEHHPTAKLVINTQTGIYYHSIQEASESYPVTAKMLVRYLLGDRRNKTPFIYA